MIRITVNEDPIEVEGPITLCESTVNLCQRSMIFDRIDGNTVYLSSPFGSAVLTAEGIAEAFKGHEPGETVYVSFGKSIDKAP